MGRKKKNKYMQITVKEDTYKLFQKVRGSLITLRGEKITEDETVRYLLEHAPVLIKA